MLRCMSPKVAHLGHVEMSESSPLSDQKRTSGVGVNPNGFHPNIPSGRFIAGDVRFFTLIQCGLFH